MAKDLVDVESCIAAVDAYRASGLSTRDWAQSHGVSAIDLRTWCRFSDRWRAQLKSAQGLDGRGGKRGKSRNLPTGFVAAVLPPTVASSVRVELPSGACVVALHWPMSHVQELGQWLREVVK